MRTSKTKVHLYNVVAIAGTFDRLHRGHEWFIKQAYSTGSKVIIGLTSDRYVQRKIKDKKSNIKYQINSFEERERELESFLKRNKLLARSEIVKIHDVYGPAGENSEIEAIVATSETLAGARQVNKRRREYGFRPLKIISIPLVKAQDQIRISSTRIRNGEIDRQGLVFSRIKAFGKPVVSSLRLALKKPLGELIRGDADNPRKIAKIIEKKVRQDKPTIICTVGDIATKICNQVKMPINLAIVDFRVNRIKRFRGFEELGFSRISLTQKELIQRVKNPPGHMTHSLVLAVKRAINKIILTGKRKIIRVIGEEDLAGVPAILLSPLGSVVLYGQPGKGIVLVEVTEEKKKELLNLIQRYN